MGLVNGRDVLITINNDADDATPVGCARSVVFDIQRDMIETSGPGNGNYRTYIPAAISFTGSIEGLVFLDKDDTGKINMGAMYSYIETGRLLTLTYYETDIAGGQYLEKSCQVYINAINETASFDNMVTFTANFTGVGAPTITYGDV